MYVRKQHIFCLQVPSTMPGVWCNSMGSLPTWLPISANLTEYNDEQRGRFITGEYKSREEVCVSNMLNNIEKQDVQNRHTSQKPIFLYKVDERLFPLPIKGIIKRSSHENYQSTKIVDNSAYQYSNSFYGSFNLCQHFKKKYIKR